MLIILDRDGVINEDSTNYIKSPDEWLVIPGSLEAIAQLNKAGHTVAIATNQSGITRGLYSEQILAAIHQKMKTELAKVGGHIDAIFYCPHRPEDNCDCRKPKPGLLLQIAKKFHANLKEAVMVGDSLKDIQAAQSVGCPVLLVKTGNGASTFQQVTHIPVFPNLAAAVQYILNTYP